MKVAFGTVVYEQAWQWWSQFVDSINEQSEGAFELLIINDGIELNKIETLKKSLKPRCHIFYAQERTNISQIRIQLLRQAKQMGYDLLILGDFDDIFSSNRVKEILELWDPKVGFFYHNLQDEYRADVFCALPKGVFEFEQILEQNFLGLSNTAINLRVLTETFFDSLQPIKTNIFDWYLYAKILLQGKTGRLVEGVYTIYRQQENNLAGIVRDDYESICREIQVKKEHYRLLQKDTSVAAELLAKYEEIERLGVNGWNTYLNKNINRYWWANLKVQKSGGQVNV